MKNYIVINQNNEIEDLFPYKVQEEYIFFQNQQEL